MCVSCKFTHHPHQVRPTLAFYVHSLFKEGSGIFGKLDESHIQTGGKFSRAKDVGSLQRAKLLGEVSNQERS